MNKRTWTLIIILAIVSLYSIGPKVDAPEFSHSMPSIKLDLLSLEDSLNNAEYYIENSKPDNQARIVWYDSLSKTKTPVSIVYLHGFTASGEEGNPMHRKIAKRYGCNLYIARLNYHGIGGDNQLQFMTSEGLYNDAKKAIAIGKKLGDEVIVMSTSTGGTLALYYAGHHDDLKALINYSPNIRIKQKASYLLDKPWGLQLARFIYQGKFKKDDCDDYDEKYWNCNTRLESIIELQSLVEHTMVAETFNNIKIPVFTGAFYKDNTYQDNTVSVEAMKWMYEQLSTDQDKKRAMPFPNAGTHVIANEVKSKAWKKVYKESCSFIEEVLRMKAINE